MPKIDICVEPIFPGTSLAERARITSNPRSLNFSTSAIPERCSVVPGPISPYTTKMLIGYASVAFVIVFPSGRRIDNIRTYLKKIV